MVAKNNEFCGLLKVKVGVVHNFKVKFLILVSLMSLYSIFLLARLIKQ